METITGRKTLQAASILVAVETAASATGTTVGWFTGLVIPIYRPDWLLSQGYGQMTN